MRYLILLITAWALVGCQSMALTPDHKAEIQKEAIKASATPTFTFTCTQGCEMSYTDPNRKMPQLAHETNGYDAIIKGLAVIQTGIVPAIGGYVLKNAFDSMGQNITDSYNNTATPTIVQATPPVIVNQPPPVIVEPQPPIVVTQPPPIIVDPTIITRPPPLVITP